LGTGTDFKFDRYIDCIKSYFLGDKPSLKEAWSGYVNHFNHFWNGRS